MIDFFDIVKLYQEDIDKQVNYKRKIIDASQNARKNKLTRTSSYFTVNVWLQQFAEAVKQFNARMKKVHTTPHHYRSTLTDYEIWYNVTNLTDGKEININVGNTITGSEIRNIKVRLYEEALGFIDVYLNTNLIRWDHFMKTFKTNPVEFGRSKTRLKSENPKIIIEMIRELITHIPTQAEE